MKGPLLGLERLEPRALCAVVAASDSIFVKRLLLFQNAAENHIAYICEEIPKLEPDLAEECRELRDRFFICPK